MHELLASADVLIESFDTQQLPALGLTPGALAEAFPHLVHVSISAFGRSGPKADWPATDLTVWAASGAQALAGDDDRAPVRTSVPQTWLHAGADAAGAALLALHARHRTGRGQHVDVSAQTSSAQAALGAILATMNNAGLQVQRVAGGLRASVRLRLTWPCLDGHVAITLLFGHAFTNANRNLLRWMHENGACSAAWVERDWGAEMLDVVMGEAEPDDYYELCQRIEQFTLVRTQSMLFEEGLKRGCYIAPTYDLNGLLQEGHFQARDFWRVQSLVGGSALLPGPFAKFSATPLRTLSPAPLPDSASVATLLETPRPPPPTGNGAAPAGCRPLDGLKVLDFMWVIAGPLFTRVLTDYGADVIKVESSTHLEPVRGASTNKNGEAGLETGVPFASFNAGKRGITIDPSNPVGREVILDLVRWADVVTESFSPRAMAGWGLDYASLRAVNPNLIMISSCLMGQTGPRAKVPGYGNMAAALTGFYDLTGWPDRSPAGPYLAYTDGVAPRFMLAGLLAALEHRRRTGQGQHIDLSQAEAAIHLLTPALLDAQLNQHVAHRCGNRDRDLCPHGVFATANHDEWLAVACRDDADWRTLAALLDGVDASWSVQERFAREDAIEAALGAWVAQRDVDAAEAELIALGIPAHRVQNSTECMADPQLAHREHFIEVPHSACGSFVVEASRYRLSDTPARTTRAGPTLGEHNYEVLSEVLGYDDDRIADVYAALAME